MKPLTFALACTLFGSTTFASEPQIPEQRAKLYREWKKLPEPPITPYEGPFGPSATVDFPTEVPIQEINENVVTVIEKWETFPHLQAHFTAPHMLEYKAKVEGMVEDVSLKILEDA